MGNCFSSQSSSSDPFSQPGRTLGSAPVASTTAAVPASVTGTKPKPSPKVGGPPRTLGGGGSSTGGGGDAEEARRKAAAAAEARAQSAKGGDLSKKLAEQKKLTHRATLEDAARKNLREREVDAGSEALRHG